MTLSSEGLHVAVLDRGDGDGDGGDDDNDLPLSISPKTSSSDLFFRLLLLLLLSSADAHKEKGVTYDGTSLIINGRRELLFSGSIHYPRSTADVGPLDRIFHF